MAVAPASNGIDTPDLASPKTAANISDEIESTYDVYAHRRKLSVCYSAVSLMQESSADINMSVKFV